MQSSSVTIVEVARAYVELHRQGQRYPSARQIHRYLGTGGIPSIARHLNRLALSNPRKPVRIRR